MQVGLAIPRLSLVPRYKSIFFCVRNGNWNDQIASLHFRYNVINSCKTNVFSPRSVEEAAGDIQGLDASSDNVPFVYRQRHAHLLSVVHFMNDEEMADVDSALPSDAYDLPEALDVEGTRVPHNGEDATPDMSP